MRRLAFVATSVLAFYSCKTKDNPLYCADGATCIDSGSGSDQHCKTNGDCTTTANPVCDTTKAGGTCVQCTAATNSCTDNAPVCDTSVDSCRACATDDDCPANGAAGVCMPSGACAGATSIVYVTSGGNRSSGTCGGSATPCDLDTGLIVAGTHADRNVLKLASGTYTSMASNFNVDVAASTKLTVDARLATFHHNSNGAIFTINSGKGMTLLGGTVELAASNGNGNAGDGDGVACTIGGTFVAYDTTFQNNDASAVDATGCALTLSAVNIHDNNKNSPGINVSGGKIEISRSRITTQKGGGLILAGDAIFTIVGNAFWNNGDPNGTVGGISLNTTASDNRFDFNTIANNKTKASSAVGGVIATVTSTFLASNNIIYGNNGAADAQVSGGPFAYSDIGPAMVPTSSDGGNNLKVDPMFQSTTDFRLKAASGVKGKADPNADLTGDAARDISGAPRAAPADMGAYVVPAS